jgi:hypothetical protein
LEIFGESQVKNIGQFVLPVAPKETNKNVLFGKAGQWRSFASKRKICKIVKRNKVSF